MNVKQINEYINKELSLSNGLKRDREEISDNYDEMYEDLIIEPDFMKKLDIERLTLRYEVKILKQYIKDNLKKVS